MTEWNPVFLMSLISVLSLMITLWTGKVLHSACLVRCATLMQSTCNPLPIAHFLRFRFWTRLAWGSPDILALSPLYVSDALLPLLAQSSRFSVESPVTCLWMCLTCLSFYAPHICLFVIPACEHASTSHSPWGLASVDVHFLYYELKIMSN